MKTKPNDSTAKAKADDPPEKKRLNDLQQTFKRIESPIDFLIALHNFIAVFVSHRSPTEGYDPKWRFVKNFSVYIAHNLMHVCKHTLLLFVIYNLHHSCVG